MTAEEQQQEFLSFLSQLMNEIVEGKIMSAAFIVVYPNGHCSSCWSTGCLPDHQLTNAIPLLGAVTHVQHQLLHAVAQGSVPLKKEDFDGRTTH